MPESWLPVFVVTLLLVGAGVLAMAVGVIFRRPCLRGSCGGREVSMASGEGLSCVACPNRKPFRLRVIPSPARDLLFTPPPAADT